MPKKRALKGALLIVSITFIFSHPAISQTWEDVERALAEENMEEAAQIITKLGVSDVEDAEAQYHIGFMYYDGTGVHKNNEAAFQWMRASAEKDFSPAQLTLAKMYSNGIGVNKDTKRYHWWMRKAAIQGDSEAQYMMGFLSSNIFDENLPYSTREGIRWLERAANQGHVEAMRTLGRTYRDGEISSNRYQDSSKAVYWLKKAADGGSSEAEAELRAIQENSDEKPKTTEKGS